jgi:hypothetical protein
VVTVVDVPNPRHFAQVGAIRDQLVAYKLAHPGRIYAVAGGASARSCWPTWSPSATRTSPSTRPRPQKGRTFGRHGFRN